METISRLTDTTILGGTMTGKAIRLTGAAILVLSVIPAGGPVYLGIIRDDVLAHSRIGDLGLQAITVSGLALMAAGLLLLLRGYRETNSKNARK